jgi:uncharacterized repeat protein (TIGR02543 family)
LPCPFLICIVFFPKLWYYFFHMKAKWAFPFLTFLLFACTNPFIEKVLQIEAKTPTTVITPAITYTVAFDSNGGSPEDSQTVTKGEKATRPDNPNRAGYGFVNWYDNEDLSEPHYDFATPVTGNITLYAKWNQIFYSVIFMDGEIEIEEKIVGEGGTASRPENPTKDGYFFDNWYSNSELTTFFNFGTQITANTTVYAKWTPITHTIIYKDVGGGNFSGEHGSGYPTEHTYDTETTLVDPARTAYIFEGWFINSNGTGTPLTSLSATGYTANIIIYAKWKLIVEMVCINPGTFMMGSPANDPFSDAIETPQHKVTLTGFYLGKYLITQAQYEAVMGTNPSYFHGGTGREPSAGEIQDKRPVEMVSWYDALVFCNKLSRSEGLNPAYRINGSTDPADWGSVPTNSDSPTKDAWDAVQVVAGSDGYRLPTEAQWEYACRAETTTAYNTGDTISDDTGWYENNSGDITHEVGLKTPNAYDLYDMHGNVWEWCWDWYGPYTSEEQTDPEGPVSGDDRVIRGGSFENPGPILRSAVRLYPFFGFRDADTGFRLARIPPAVTHTVTFDSGGGSSMDSQIVVEGKKIIRPPNPEKSGYDFDNWYSNPALTVLYNFDTPVSGGVTLYAKWKLTIEMVWINPGTFLMGSPETEPERTTIADRETQHQVTLKKGFYMGKHPVTQWQYETVMGTNPSSFTTPVSPETSTANRPVERVSWYDVLVFCNKLSMNEGLSPAYRISGSTDPAVWGTVPTTKNPTWDAVQIVEGSTGYRLPTEAQWEYACRAGTTTPFNTGYNITTGQANYDGNTPYDGNPSGIYRERTTEVGSFAPNAWGLCDMHGNVSEWCGDWYGIYTDGAQTDPTGADSGFYRIIRGGAWNLVGHSLRSAFRLERNPIIRYDSIGFRLVKPSD